MKTDFKLKHPRQAWKLFAQNFWRERTRHTKNLLAEKKLTIKRRFIGRDLGEIRPQLGETCCKVAKINT